MKEIAIIYRLIPPNSPPSLPHVPLISSLGGVTGHYQNNKDVPQEDQYLLKPFKDLFEAAIGSRRRHFRDLFLDV